MSECTNNCAKHCQEPVFAAPEVPYPHLLLHNDIVPSDAQVRDINLAIDSARQTVSFLDSEIAAHTRAIARLSSQRAAVDAFIAAQSAIVTGIRRLPSELLLAVFSYCANPAYPPFHKYNTISKVLQVCARWRDVAIGCPPLWRHVALTGGLQLRGDALKVQVAAQLQRSGESPLSLVLRASNALTGDLLDLVGGVAPRWQQADIHVHPEDFRRLFIAPLPVCGMLRKLVLVYRDGSAFDGLSSTELIALFPVLQDFTLRVGPTGHIPQIFDLLWNQLRVTRIEECNGNELPQVLRRLAEDSELVLKNCSPYIPPAEEADTTPDGDTPEAPQRILIHTAIDALALSQSDALAKLLDRALVAPRLTKLGIPAIERLMQSTITFLARSGCTLTHLSLAITDKNKPLLSELTSFLRAVELHDLRHLDLTINAEREDSAKLLGALAEGAVPMLPYLQTLTVRESKVDLAALRALHAARRPVLRTVRVPSSTNVPRVPLEGLEVEFSKPFAVGVW
ncbi:hypothetical protein MKEN_00576000 [Mycena kentingensis (nom. inval.)]|nr:hypothetical protein MKEN_00576000 [Mycena kentingensis (nom. inval.)]